jgi:TRAP-type transport system periplasmic protein
MINSWRKAIGVGLFLTVVLILAACSDNETSGSTDKDGGSNSSQAAIDLSISSFMPGPHPQHTELFEPFIKDIEDLTDGRVSGTMYAANALGEADAQFDLTVSGVADMAMALHSYTPGRFPATSVTELPFMGKNAEDGTRIFWSLYEKFPEVFDNEHEGTNIAWLFKNDPAQILTVDKPIHSPEDLEGLKIRTPSPAANGILESYAAIPVSMPMGEVYEAMQRGVVDGALAPTSVITNFQLGDVTGYITKGNFYTSSLFVVMNPTTWEQISPKDQEAIEGLMGEKMAMEAGKLYDIDGEAGWTAAEEAGIEIYEIPDEEMDKWKKPLEPMYDKWLEDMDGNGIPAQEILDEAIRLVDEGE